MRFSICTLGCKSNQYESQAMAKLLLAQGHQQVPEGDIVDAYIINTCSVTAVGDKKSRQAIRKARKQNENALIAVCGCYAQLEPEDIAALEVNLIGGTGNHQEFITELESLWHSTNPTQVTLPQDNPRQRLGIEALPSGGLEGHTRALLKIQDGCDNFCTYCIIPYARGKIRSLPPTEACLAIHELIAQGYEEIVLTGIEISSWGKDLPGEQSLLHFLDMANSLVEGYRQAEGKEIFFRLGSLEPRTITREFCQKASTFPSLRPHFHLSLQSGSDGVLKRMNRKYDTGRYLESVQLLREYFPQVAITTDLIVGFPQETQEEFQETLAFMEQCAFASVHVFPYSPREGTPAAKMDGQIPKETKDQRAKTASALAGSLQEKYQNQFLHSQLPVLFETQNKDGYWIGHSPQHFQVQAKSDLDIRNTTRLVRLVKQENQILLGEIQEIKGE